MVDLFVRFFWVGSLVFFARSFLGILCLEGFVQGCL